MVLVSIDDWDVSVNRTSSGEVDFEVTVPEDEVESERKQALNELKQDIEMPGFRKGKVPDSMIKKQRPQQVQQALLQRLVPKVCQEVYQEHDIEPIQNPSVEDFDFDDGFHLEASVLERPTVDVSDAAYKDLELTVEDQSVSEEEVEERLDELRSARASLEPVPIARPVEEGDFVDIDFQGYDESGAPLEGTSGEDQVIEVGSERFLPEVEEGLVGISEGETRRIPATFPDDFVDDSLAGESVDFEVTVNEIKEERKPDLDSEEFLDEMEVESVEELRDQVRERLDQGQEQSRRDELSEQVYDELLERYDIDIPETLIDDEVDTIIDDYRQQVESQDRDFDEFLEQQDQTLEELREESRPDAERRIKLTLLFQAIADEADIEVTEEDYEEHLEELSEQTGMDVGDLEDLPEEQQRSLRYQLRDDKVLDLLIEEADVEEVEPKDDEAGDDASEEAEEAAAISGS
jgi:trigger factor